MRTLSVCPVCVVTSVLVSVGVVGVNEGNILSWEAWRGEGLIGERLVLIGKGKRLPKRCSMTDRLKEMLVENVNFV